jgi:hypothetical protein
MKFNTKTCTLIQGSPETMVRPNKYIVNNKKDTNNDVLITICQEEVRERKYLPTIIYTPVLASKRIDHHRRLLSYDDVEELNQKLADIFLEHTDTTTTTAAAAAAAAATTSSTTEESLSSYSSSSGDEEEEPEQGCQIETNAESSSDQDATNKEDNRQEKEEKASLLGRVYKAMFSYKTCKTSKVLRSSRLLAR